MRSCITMFSFRKRKCEFDESMDHYRKMCKQRIEKQMQEMDGEFMSIVATTLSNLTVKKTTKRRSKDVQRDQTWCADGYRNWSDGYRNWSDVEFIGIGLNRKYRNSRRNQQTQNLIQQRSIDNSQAHFTGTLMAHPSSELDIYSESQKSWLGKFFIKLLVLLCIFCTKSSSGYRLQMMSGLMIEGIYEILRLPLHRCMEWFPCIPFNTAETIFQFQKKVHCDKHGINLVQ